MLWRFPILKFNVSRGFFGSRLRRNDNAHWGENRRFQPPKKVNVARGILGSRLRERIYLKDAWEVPASAEMTVFIGVNRRFPPSRE
jgi:hypothetical protein